MLRGYWLYILIFKVHTLLQIEDLHRVTRLSVYNMRVLMLFLILSGSLLELPETFIYGIRQSKLVHNAHILFVYKENNISIIWRSGSSK